MVDLNPISFLDSSVNRKKDEEVNFNQMFSTYLNLFHCRFGGTEGATFCALTTLCKELETFNAIDVYQVSKLYHNKRPGIWKSPVILTLFLRF